MLFPKLFLRGCLMKAPPDVDTWGINLKSDQLIHAIAPPPHHDAANFLEWLDRTGWQIVYLYRKNVVRQAISNEVANARLRWNVPANTPVPAPKVALDPATLLGVVRWFDDSREAERRSLQGIPCLKLCYEDDLLSTSAQRATMERVFGFLRVETVAVEPTTRRLASDDLAASVANYDDIVSALSGTKYAAMVGEP